MPVYSTVRSQILSRDVHILAEFWNRRDSECVPARWGSDSCLDRASAASAEHRPAWRHGPRTCKSGTIQLVWAFPVCCRGFIVSHTADLLHLLKLLPEEGFGWKWPVLISMLGFFASTKFIKFETYAHPQCLVLNTEITSLRCKETVSLGFILSVQAFPEMCCCFTPCSPQSPALKHNQARVYLCNALGYRRAARQQ